MKPTTKRILTISAITAGAGLILMGIGLGIGGRPGVIFSSSGIRSPYEKQELYFQEKTPLEAFSNLDINIGSEAAIQILPSKDEKYYIEYQLEGEYGEPVCQVTNDTLTLYQASKQLEMGIWGLNFGSYKSVSPYITLYLPEDILFKQSDIYNDYGNIEISGIKFQTASITANSGDVTLNTVSAEKMTLDMDNGNLTADALKADKLSVLSDYGSAELKESVLGSAKFQLESGDLLCDTVTADSLKAVSESGNVRFNETSCKTADFTLDYGDLEFDAVTLESLNCEMESGDIDLSLPEAVQNYQFAIEMDYGHLDLPEDALLEHYREEAEEVSYHADASTKKSNKIISIRNENGDVNIRYR